MTDVNRAPGQGAAERGVLPTELRGLWGDTAASRVIVFVCVLGSARCVIVCVAEVIVSAARVVVSASQVIDSAMSLFL